ERPKACQALQQHRLADAGRTTDQERVTRLETQVEIADEVSAVGSTNSDAVDVECAIPRRSRRHLGECAGERVLVDQAVKADDRRAVACERVIRVPEERQRVVDRVKCGGRLEDVAERYFPR